jgi:ATP-dependent helicase/DNAse subunit B
LKLPKEITQGSNKLQLKIIERIAQKILENDALDGSLTVIHTEDKFIWETLKLEDGTFAAIQGTFDRIDKLSEKAVRIIDYKTGEIELPKFPDLEHEDSIHAFLDTLFIFKQKDYSAAFQGILYALMYYKLHDCQQIYIGYHHAKKMKEGISYLNEQQPIPVELLLHFEKRLAELVSDIIYKNPVFLQSENENAYQYSVYAELLGID